MKEVYVLRHAPKDNGTGELTEAGKEMAHTLRDKLPSFQLVIASDSPRTQETGTLLTGQTPHVDARAGYFMATPEQSALLNRQAASHPLGFTGALFALPELQNDIEQKAKELINLIDEVLDELPSDAKALIVSHDMTMVPAEKLLTDQPLTPVTSIFKPLSGYIVNEDHAVHLFEEKSLHHD